MRTAIVTLVVLAVAALPPEADAFHSCTAQKIRAVGRDAFTKLKCHARAASRGEAVDSSCLTDAEARFAGSFPRAEARPPCFATGDAPDVEAIVDALADDVAASLRPTAATSQCAARLLAATAREAAGKLRCHHIAVGRGIGVSVECLTRKETAFATAFTLATARDDCPTGVDSGAIESRVDAFVDDGIAALRPLVPSGCAAKKLRAAGTKVAGTLDCHAVGARSGIAGEPGCLDGVEARFGDKFAEAEAGDDCVTVGDASSIEAQVDSFVTDITGALGPVTAPSACAERKLREVGDRAQVKLGLHAISVGNGWPLDGASLEQVEERFAASFGEAESAGDCITTGDAAAIGSEVDAFVADVTSALAP